MTEYDFILDQYEQHGVEYVDALMDRGFVPVYVSGKGWTWIMPVKSNERVNV